MSWRTAIGLLLVAMSIGLHVQCSNDEPDGDVSKKARGEASPKTPARVTFENRLEGSGVDFAHVSGARGKRYLIETMGSGVVLFDYDADGDPDLYFVQSGPHPGEGTPVGNRLYRNDGEWQFEDVTGAAGVGDTGYGMGGTAADIDNDGDLDLYVTNFGANVLYRNRGDGTFEDITEAAGVGHTGWGTSCTFLDYDRDGLLDLYVVNYLAMTYETHRDCYFRDLLIYCSPGEYPGQPDVLYRNLGDGKFEDVTAKAGIRSDAESKGLGVIASDLDGDGFVDLYVANDSTPNFLYRNEGDGTFEEIGLRAGVSRDANGRAESGMGVDAADYDGDGDFDLIVTNYQGETNTLYQNDGDWSFLDVTTPTKLTAATFYYLGFGVAWFDADGDGWQDLAFANGHVMDNVAKTDRTAKHAQKNNFLLGAALGQRRVYEDCTARAGEGFETELVSRGLATGDLDGDGDIDLVA
ncbi:MAG: VCBS repeat-containing protein, partial [Planctomycetota bacterium]